VRCYTQNIDGLEAREGLCLDIKRGKGSRSRFTKNVVSKPRPNGPTLPGSQIDGGCEVVQLHGDLEALRCGLCSALCSWEDEDRESILMNGRAPECHSCASKDENRRFSGKRGTAVGGLRPNIVLYGEEHPSPDLLSPITTSDLKLGPDILIILGTSLRVHGLKVMVREFAKAVHARGSRKVILVNRTKPAESVWSNVIDYWVSMDCDEWVADLRQRRGDLWERQGALNLPVTKGIRPKVVRSKKERIMKGAVTVNGKENIIKKKKAEAKRAVTTKKRPEKSVDARPVQKATKAKVQKPGEGLSRPLAQQVLTPSLDDSEATQPIRPPKRRITNMNDEDFLLSSPTKRKRERVQVWIDCDAKTGHARPNESVYVEVPCKGKKRTTKERSQTGIQVKEVA
jgi:NAD-dependent SIR2 family protein deacetylase